MNRPPSPSPRSQISFSAEGTAVCSYGRGSWNIEPLGPPLHSPHELLKSRACDTIICL